MKAFVSTLLAVCGSCAICQAQPQADLPARARGVLERNCARCHSGPGSAAEFDVRQAASLIDNGIVEPGQAKDSLLRQLTFRGTMPPRGNLQLPRPTAEDVQILTDWIDAGAAEFPLPDPRTAIPLKTTLRAVHDDLKKIRDAAVRQRQRYFSLVELHNNPSASDESLKLARAALSKALNSLTWERELVTPRAVDAAETIYAVDLQDLGWGRDHWRAVRSRYPYAVGFENLDDDALDVLESDIRKLAGNAEPLLLVRADWFVVTATQPPLYHTLLFELALPELKKRQPDRSQPANPLHMTAGDLERFLEVDVIANIIRGDQAQRCGFTPSGVSGQNRLIERHKTRYGAYWKSYDFKADNRRAILSQFPLGPKFPGNRFAELAFEHDGGEIIFHLPNGLQGYLLIDGKDNRIDAGPIEVVSDALKTSGTPAIVNGLSCMACHKHGMIEPPEDEIRTVARVFGDERKFLQRLYPERGDFMKSLDKDANQFLAALDKVVSPTLRVDGEERRTLKDFAEPVSETARRYLLEDLDLATVAAELHEPDVQRLRARLEQDELLRELGLGVLLTPGGKIKRAYWEGRTGGPSVMQLAAFSLGYAIREFKD